MSTTTQPLKYLWTVVFEDGHEIKQPSNDHYSKHDDIAEWNPSAFRDIQEYSDTSNVWVFYLDSVGKLSERYYCDLKQGLFTAYNPNGTTPLALSLENEPLSDRKLIYYREMQQDSVDGSISEPYVVRYAIGYEGKNSLGKIEKKVIYLG